MKVLVAAFEDRQVAENFSASSKISDDLVFACFDESVAEEGKKFFKEVYLIKAGSYDPSVYSEALKELYNEVSAEAVLMESSAKGVAVASMLSAKLGVRCVSDVKVIEDGYVRRSALGAAEAKVKVDFPIILCVKPGSFEKAEGKESGEIKVVEKSFESKVNLVEFKEKEKGVDISEAEVVVCAGRGVKKKEDLAMLEELAKLLNGAVGVSRPLSADLKWMPNWVGMSGIAVKPKLYIGVGVSGQIQHVAGIRDSKIIVAINNDPKAPIFENADYGIVGDLYEVVPKLIEKLKQS